MIHNTDQRSKDYGEIAEKFRPGHADITYWQKYGIRDYRGGGRSSARETAARVAAGGVARAALAQLAAGRCGSPATWCRWARTRSTARASTGTRSSATRSGCRMPQAAADWADYLDGLRKSGNSVGAVIEVVARGVPAGPGRADLRQARHRPRRRDDVDQRGQGRRDRRRAWRRRALTGDAKCRRDRDGAGRAGLFSSNHAGGILGGISTGQDIVVRFAVKPTSSILTPRKTITKSRRRRPRSSPRAATTPASASAPCRWARR